MIIRGRLTSVPSDAPVPNGTSGQVIRLNGNAVLATVTTTDGWYEWITDGNPGRVKTNFSYDGKVKNQWSEITGPSNGVDIGNLWMALAAFQSGRVKDFSGELAVSAAGGGMYVTVAPGAALVKGQLYDRYSSGNVTIGTSAAQPRKDLVVVRCYLNDTGDADEGRTSIVVIPGTPSPSPAAPSLINTSTIFDLLLATVTVPASASAISSGNVVANPVFARPYIGPGSIGSTEIQDFSIGTSDLADNIIITNKIVDGSITFSKFNASAVGSGASQVAAGTHTHTSAAITNFNAAVSALIPASPTVQIAIYNNAGGFVGYANRLDMGAGLDAVDIGGGLRKQIFSTGGKPTLLPGTEYVATGAISSGSRTLNTMAVGPLLSGVQYDIQMENAVTLRGQASTGTVILKARINAGTWRTHELQAVGGVPRWAAVKQSATITGTGATIDVQCAVDYSTGDPTDIRAGQVSVIAIPR